MEETHLQREKNEASTEGREMRGEMGRESCLNFWWLYRGTVRLTCPSALGFQEVPWSPETVLILLKLARET